jgi:peroxiredoxin
MPTVTLGGNPVNVGGNFLKPGDNAPQFEPEYDAALAALK